MLRLSIITTLYQSAGYMDKCLGTLLDQDLAADEYEIILVNDGSPDNSLQIAQSYAAEHTNIKVVSYEVNRGLAGARQAGTNAAEGKYLCYVDPDDYINTRSFKAALDRMEKDGLDMLRFDYQMVDEDYKPIRKPKDARMIDYSAGILDGTAYLNTRLGYACFVWAFIYKTSLIKDSGVRFRQGDYFDDTAWLPQIMRKAEKIDTSDEVRYFYLQRGGSLVNTRSEESIKRKIEAMIVVINRLKEQEQTDWHRAMISKTSLSVLSDAATLSYPAVEFAEKIKSLQVFPLKAGMMTGKQKLKCHLANLSPSLFVRLLHFINR